MKKFLLSFLVVVALGLTAAAQNKEVKATDKKVKVETSVAKSKVKKTSTPKQKVHNILHPKRKKYSGVKVKHEAKKD
ncbi:hypothetical protein [Flavisolibacter nicotianae]|uniref:hypothetical protein n=1 Tax=Flavisolibacter nicotianae TaxID=2364882 RepID=UPI000EB38BD3|nr:hypothetical protein [Flavisolibacter nicotianae]